MMAKSVIDHCVNELSWRTISSPGRWLMIAEDQCWRSITASYEEQPTLVVEAATSRCTACSSATTLDPSSRTRARFLGLAHGVRRAVHESVVPCLRACSSR